MPRAFQPDLDGLSELAASFARAYPALAPRLADRSGDPDVERLLEAFIYLTERVHDLADAGSEAGAQVFGDLLAPELARPFPSATVLAIGAPKDARMHVPVGAEFDSVPVDGTRSRFRAWSAFDLVPWVLEDARISWSTTEGQSLDVSLRPSGRAPIDSLFPLRLHFAGDSRAALTLLLFMRLHLVDIELQIGGDAAPRRSIGKRVRPWGLAASEALLPPEPFEHPGLRLLREYFVLPAKFAFVEIDGALADTSPTALEAAGPITLRFRFDTQLPLTIHVSKENVRINCVPVANVFETTTDPVAPTLERPVHVLRPAGIPLGHGETYSVTRVRARLAGRSSMETIAPFSDFEAAPATSLPDLFYVARSVPTASRRGNETHLSLGSPADGPPIPAIDHLSIDILADNGALPSALGIGDVSVPCERSPRGLAFRNISAVSTYRAPASGEDLRWRTLAVTSLSALSLTSAETLQTQLHVLNLHAIADAQAARAHGQLLSSVLAVTSTAARTRVPSSDPQERATSFVVGHDVAVDVSGTGFDGEGEALVFASALAGLFAHEASLGMFTRTTVRVVETGRTFAFPALHGDRNFDEAKMPEST